MAAFCVETVILLFRFLYFLCFSVSYESCDNYFAVSFFIFFCAFLCRMKVRTVCKNTPYLTEAHLGHCIALFTKNNEKTTYLKFHGKKKEIFNICNLKKINK